jgi:hypothetical protein
VVVPGFAALALALTACGDDADGDSDVSGVSGSVAVDG